MKVYLLKAAPEGGGQPLSELPQETENSKGHPQQSDDGRGGAGSSEEDDEDRFITLLKSFGIDSELVPVLVFEYSNLEELWRHLKHPAQHAGIIFSSPRCVHSIREAIKIYDADNQWNSILQKEWASKHIFCVGLSTMDKATQLLTPLSSNQFITGLKSHADSLAEKILEVNARCAITLPLLYPCGVQRRDVLQKLLTDAKLQYNICTVYNSIKNPTLDVSLSRITQQLKKAAEGNAVFCFFSPSGVKYVFQSLDVNVLSEDHNTHVVAIGPTTKTALEELFLSLRISKRIHQCMDPTPEALLNLLKSEISS